MPSASCEFYSTRMSKRTALIFTVHWTSCLHQRQTGGLFQSILQYCATWSVLSKLGDCHHGIHSGKPDYDHSNIPGLSIQNIDFQCIAKSVPAACTNHQIVIFSTNQACAYLQNFPWPDLHSMGKLASHGWYCHCHRRLQQRKLFFIFPGT